MWNIISYFLYNSKKYNWVLNAIIQGIIYNYTVYYKTIKNNDLFDLL